MSVRKHLVFVFTILTLLLGSFAFYTLADKSDEKPADLEKRALKAYTEKTYSKALPLYEKLLASKASAAVLRDAELKVVICLARLRQYDKSLERGQAYAKALAGTVWAGRHQRTLGGIWYHKPHYGYRKGGKTTWGRHVQGGTYVNSQASDMENAVKSYEAARNNFLALDAMRRVGQVKKGEAPPLPEILGTNGELATALSMLSQRRYHRLRPGFVINPPKVYDIKKLNLEERLIFIYDELYRLAAEGGQRRVQAVALYHKGMHFRRMRNYRRQQDSSKLDPAVPELIKRYRDPIPLFERLLAQFPKQKIVVDARIALGMMHRMQGRYLAAKTQFERVIEDFPKSTWVSDAKHYIAYMTREEVTVTTLGHFDPKAKKEVTIGTRNLKDFTVRIYPFDLAGFSNEGSILSDYRISLGQINSVYHSLALVKKYAGKQLGQ